MAEKRKLYWKAISPQKVMESVNWALANWKPNTKIDHSCDQVIQNTWIKLDMAYGHAKTQIKADWEQLLYDNREEE